MNNEDLDVHLVILLHTLLVELNTCDHVTLVEFLEKVVRKSFNTST